MKKVIIVGAGIAGLTAGIYARMSGFEATIYESHTIAGGASTSWKREGYLFEGGIHWLNGSSPYVPLNKLWREVGALNDGVKIINHDPFFTFEHQGQTAYLFRDVKKLKQHFLEIAQQDQREIHRLCRDIEKFSHFQMPITDIKGLKTKNKSSMSFFDVLRMLPALPRMGFYGKLTAKTYAERFNSPVLKLLLQNVVGPDINAIGLLFTLSTLMSGDGGYPEGGSLAMARRMAQYFEQLGGTIEYKQFVDKVAIENNVANGIIIDKKHIPADAVIVTQDTLSAIDTLFDSPIDEPWVHEMRKKTTPMLNTFISLGVKADLSSQPKSLFFSLDKPLILAGQPQSVISFNNYATYKDYAPTGCTALTTAILGDSYDFWKQCQEDGTYALEKQKLAETYISALSDKIPGIADKVAVWDVATPLTYERYLHSYKGSWMTTMNSAQPQIYPQKPKTLGNLYFAGQRLRSPGGLPVALDSGRKAVQHLCLDTNAIFQNNR